ncbi:MAG: hypothetical protein INF44_04120 [Thalassospira sp.]|jgi:hypothetical protein|nr:hypothetical protein [Thalassospira sp.]
MFNLENIPDYLKFCAQAVAEFETDQANVLRGFSAILALNHIPDWLQYKLTSKQRAKLGLDIKIDVPVRERFQKNNEKLKLVREIANGFKHLRPADSSTNVVNGYGKGPFGIGPFGCPYLLIDLGKSYQDTERRIVGLTLCKEVLIYWEQELSPIL